MTHIIYLAEGYREDMDRLAADIEKLHYPLTEKGTEVEMATHWRPDVRELRLYDIVVKDGIKDKFLADFLCKAGGTFDEEVWSHKFKIGMFRRMIQSALSMIGLKPLPVDHIKRNEHSPLRQGGYKCHGMILGQLPDTFEKDGREWT